jgi:hypothetical protein
MMTAQATALCSRPAFVQSGIGAHLALLFLNLYRPFLLSKPDKRTATTDAGQPQ